MKISFHWYDRKGKTPCTKRFSFQKYWSGDLWYFNFWKWSMVWDFRTGNFITWALDDIKKLKWKAILRNRRN